MRSFLAAFTQELTPLEALDRHSDRRAGSVIRDCLKATAHACGISF
jgi:hypothetical protein